MTNISINGNTLPAPDAYGVEYETVGSFERNANGNMIGDLVAVKTIITAGWAMLDDESFKMILSHTKPFFGTVEFYDPNQGARAEKIMYTKPRGGQVALNGAGQLWWKDVTCVFIER